MSMCELAAGLGGIVAACTCCMIIMQRIMDKD